MNFVFRVAFVGMLSLVLYLGLPKGGIEQMADSKADAVVLIMNGTEGQKGGSLGTGFIIDDDLIVTNNHVIANGKDILVRGKSSQKPYKAQLIAADEFSDIALIKLEDWKDFALTNLPSKLEFNSSRDLKLGAKVWSIGHPWGLQWSVSQGVVSSPSRRMDGNLNFLIQTDTRIYEGNSGGPLLDEHGKVIGINDKMMANTGGSFGLAIPSDLAVKVIEDLRLRGKVEWSVMGIKMGYTEDGKNVMIKDVIPGSAAEKAGLKSGDIILNITTPHTPLNGVDVRNTDQLLDEMAVINVDDAATLGIRRGDQLSSILVDPDIKESKDLMTKEQPTNK